MGGNTLQNVEHLINPRHVFTSLDIFCQLNGTLCSNAPQAASGVPCWLATEVISTSVL